MSASCHHQIIEVIACQAVWCCVALIADSWPVDGSMWIFTADGQPVPGSERVAFFLAAGKHSVGRQTGQGNDIELATDPSISRKHAELHVSALYVRAPPASVPSLQLTGARLIASVGATKQCDCTAY